jgi:hypothetical protein
MVCAGRGQQRNAFLDLLFWKEEAAADQPASWAEQPPRGRRNARIHGMSRCGCQAHCGLIASSLKTLARPDAAMSWIGCSRPADCRRVPDRKSMPAYESSASSCHHNSSDTLPVSVAATGPPPSHPNPRLTPRGYLGPRPWGGVLHPNTTLEPAGRVYNDFRDFAGWCPRQRAWEGMGGVKAGHGVTLHLEPGKGRRFDPDRDRTHSHGLLAEWIPRYPPNHRPFCSYALLPPSAEAHMRLGRGTGVVPRHCDVVTGARLWRRPLAPSTSLEPELGCTIAIASSTSRDCVGR